MTWDFRLLGPLEVRRGQSPVVIRPPQQRGVLAMLLLHAGEVVPVQQLVDALWERPHPRAR